MSTQVRRALRGDVRIDHEDDSSVFCIGNGRIVRIRAVPPRLYALLEHSRTRPVAVEELAEAFAGTHAQIRDLLTRLDSFFDLVVVDEETGTIVARAEQLGPYPDPKEGQRERDILSGTTPSTLVVHHHAFAQFTDGAVLFESASSSRRVAVYDADEAARAVRSLVDERLYAGPDPDPVSALLYLAGVLVTDDDAMKESDPTDPANRWDFHDQLMHKRSRWGRMNGAFGATYPHLGVVEPEPAIKKLPPGERIELDMPSWEDVASSDTSVLVAMEARRSLRRGDRVVSLDELSTFLYRTLRVRTTTAANADTPYDTTSRPYPSGGASYELEAYLLVRRCIGLEAGIYYYAPQEHALIRINDAQAAERVHEFSGIATGNIADADIAISLAARFGRLNWKYRAITYSATLKNVGVLYQTMYLVATAMRLSLCGLGSGDAWGAAALFGTDPAVESSVGDILLSGGLDERASPIDAIDQSNWHLRARDLLANGEDR